MLLVLYGSAYIRIRGSLRSSITSWPVGPFQTFTYETLNTCCPSSFTVPLDDCLFQFFFFNILWILPCDPLSNILHVLLLHLISQL